MTPDATEPTSPDTAPLSLSPELLAALRRIAGTEHLLVAMDFDGTMAPLVDHAGGRPRAPALRSRLRRADGTSADDDGAHLRPGAGQPAGRRLPAGEDAADRQPRRRSLDGARLLGTACSTTPSGNCWPRSAGSWRASWNRPRGPCWKTSRPASSCTRGSPRTTSPRTPSPRPGPSCRTAAASSSRRGNRVLETSVVNASKGEGIAFLRQAAGATAVAFAGDDTTDEDALASLRPGRSRGEGGARFHPGRVPGGGAGARLRTAGGPAA